MDNNTVELNDSHDCALPEAELTTITLDTTVDETVLLNNSIINVSDDNSDCDVNVQPHDKFDESILKQKNDKLLFRLEFKNDETFDELHTLISTCIRDALFSLKKSTIASIDKHEYSVSFLETGSDDTENIFMIDTLPTENTNTVEIPNYKSVTEALLHNDVSKIEELTNIDRPKASNACWNCNGDHNLRDCNAPHDKNNINRAKQIFMRTKTERYHVDADQKFGNLAPGQISDGLREALGLRKRELPLYIYKMRLYGYPPGWLEDAKVSHSGLSLFNLENQVHEPSVEDGEIDKVAYDSTKFISYPGFNAELPIGVIDDTSFYKVPQMQYHHTREGLMQALQGNLAKSYKRKKLKLNANIESCKNLIEDNMDVASDCEESPQSKPEPECNTENIDSTLGSTKISEDIKKVLNTTGPERLLENLSDCNSPSLNELEREKRNLLKALADTSFDSAIVDDHSIANEKDVKEDSKGSPLNKNDLDIDMCAAVTISQVQSVLVTPEIKCRSKETVFGTPLLKQVSPFSKIPSGDKWSAGVTDVIDFENLPDTTGTYKKLGGIIDKVRNVVKRINDANDAEDP